MPTSFYVTTQKRIPTTRHFQHHISPWKWSTQGDAQFFFLKALWKKAKNCRPPSTFPVSSWQAERDPFFFKVTFSSKSTSQWQMFKSSEQRKQLLPFHIFLLFFLCCAFSSGSCFWVAELEGKVVGAVAAARLSDDVVELLRMCVDRSYRRRGVGFVLGQEVLQFAATHRYSSVVLGTTAYTDAAHQLYKRLGFHCVGVTNGYMTPGSTQSFLEMIFYRVQHYHYSCNVKHSKITSSGQHWPVHSADIQ